MILCKVGEVHIFKHRLYNSALHNLRMNENIDNWYDNNIGIIY